MPQIKKLETEEEKILDKLLIINSDLAIKKLEDRLNSLKAEQKKNQKHLTKKNYMKK